MWSVTVSSPWPLDCKSDALPLCHWGHKLTCLMRCRMYSKQLLVKTEMLVYQSKVSLDVKFLLGNITGFLNQEIWTMLARSLARTNVGNESSTFNSGPWFTRHLKSNPISENGYFTKSKFRREVNHGPESGMEYSLPYEFLTSIFLSFWIWMICDFIKQNFHIQVSNFHIQVSFDWWINIKFWISTG